MKRIRREMRKETEIRAAIEELSLLQQLKVVNLVVDDDTSSGGDGVVPMSKPAGEDNNSRREVVVVVSHIPTGPFLSLCRLMIQVLDKIGPTMAVMRQDIHQNIQRLESVVGSDPARYSNIIEVLKKEADQGNARKNDSCSKAVLWLTRSLDLAASLLKKLAYEEETVINQSRSMENIVEESYSVAFKPWHGWISIAAYKVALKLLPDTKTFINLLVEEGDEKMDTLREQVQSLLSLLVPLLDDLHVVLRLYGLDQLKCK